MAAVRLHGFNNLSKSLSLSLYDIHYAPTPADKQACLRRLDTAHDAEHLSALLTEVAETIGAQVLNIARQDYEPEGASATLLIAEEPMPTPETVVGHLDKSHIAVHTYPESHPDTEVVTLRADIDVATCGLVSPLQALDTLLSRFNPDVAAIDYRVRGFTRDVEGRKHFLDQPMASIQEHLSATTQAAYHLYDANQPATRSFHTRMRVRSMAGRAACVAREINEVYGVDQADLTKTV